MVQWWKKRRPNAPDHAPLLEASQSGWVGAVVLDGFVCSVAHLERGAGRWRVKNGALVALFGGV